MKFILAPMEFDKEKRDTTMPLSLKDGEKKGKGGGTVSSLPP